MHPKSIQSILEKTVVIIPAYNEAASMALVLDNLAREGITRVIVALDPHNRDDTVAVLARRGVPYVVAPSTGYDNAVHAATQALPRFHPDSEYVLFSDAGNKYDCSVVLLFARALASGADMVLGNRVNAWQYLLWHQRLGTQLVLLPIRMYFGAHLHDLGPVRMARRALIEKLDMRPKMFRWPTESLVKALAIGAKVVEVPITLTPRIGTSKVSGNLKRSLRAGLEMYSALKFFRYKIQ